MTIQFSAQLEKTVKQKDGSLVLTIETQEMSPIDSAEIFELYNKQIWVAMAETAIKESDLNIPKEVSEFGDEKTPSERLRAVLYVYWDTKTDKKKTFEEWRRIAMEKIINHYKEKLD